MIHPAISTQIVDERTRDLVREAERGRLARAVRRPRRTRVAQVAAAEAGTAAGIAIRPAEAWDGPAITRLAELDGRPVPCGAVIVAERDGELIAARALFDGDEAISDPFRHAGLARALLALRADEARRERGRRGQAVVPGLGAAVAPAAPRSDAALC